MNTLPSGGVNGFGPRPAVTIVRPIWLSTGHAPTEACGSGHSVTLESMPAIPGGRCIETPCTAWSESARLMSTVNGVNPPAWRFLEPATKPGVKGCGLVQALPPGPEEIPKLEDEGASALPDHGVNDAAVE